MNKNKVCMGEMLTELMAEKEISSAELGKILKIPASTIKDWKKGRIKPVVDGDLLAVAHFFKVTIEYLCFGSEKKFEVENL